MSTFLILQKMSCTRISFLQKALSRIGAICLLAVLGLGCGYTFQTSKNPVLVAAGIQTVFVEPPLNATSKPGVDAIVYHELMRALQGQGRVKVIQNKSEADAILSVTVSGAGYAPTAGAVVSSLNPKPLQGPVLATAGLSVASEYLAGLSCSFSLVTNAEKRARMALELAAEEKEAAAARAQVALKGKSQKEQSSSGEALRDSGEAALSPPKRALPPAISWSAGFGRSMTFAATNQLDVPGTTSVLINESNFDRTLADMAHLMMYDMNEALFNAF